MKKILKYGLLGVLAISIISAIPTFITALFSDEPEELPETNQIAVEQVENVPESNELHFAPQVNETPAEEIPEEIAEEVSEEVPEEIPEPQEEIQEPVEAPPEEIETPVEKPKEKTPAVVPAPVEVEEPEEEQEKEYDFVLNTSTNKYHDIYCSDGKRIKSKNRAEFHGTISEVESKGYVACKKCGGI